MKLRSIIAIFPLVIVCPLAGAAKPTDAIAPELVAMTLDGKNFDLTAQRGHVVLVNFWATWCTPCIKEMPALEVFSSSH